MGECEKIKKYDRMMRLALLQFQGAWLMSEEVKEKEREYIENGYEFFRKAGELYRD